MAGQLGRLAQRARLNSAPLPYTLKPPLQSDLARIDEAVKRFERELGTLRYMAPKQAADAKGAGPPSDVYALGKILARTLSGHKPTPLVST